MICTYKWLTCLILENFLLIAIAIVSTTKVESWVCGGRWNEFGGLERIEYVKWSRLDINAWGFFDFKTISSPNCLPFTSLINFPISW